MKAGRTDGMKIIRCGGCGAGVGKAHAPGCSRPTNQPRKGERKGA